MNPLSIVALLALASYSSASLIVLSPASGSVGVGINGAVIAGPSGSVRTDNGLGGHGAAAQLSGPAGDVRTRGGAAALDGPGLKGIGIAAPVIAAPIAAPIATIAAAPLGLGLTTAIGTTGIATGIATGITTGIAATGITTGLAAPIGIAAPLGIAAGPIGIGRTLLAPATAGATIISGGIGGKW